MKTLDLPPDVTPWLAQMARQGVAANTRRAYASDRRYFVAWHRARFNANPTLPLPETVVISFVADSLATLPRAIDVQLQTDGHKATRGPHALTTVQRRLAALHVWHLEQGQPSACRSPTVRQLVRRARHALRPHPPARSQPLTLDLLQRLLATCDDSLRGQRDQALLLIGWCCGGRRRSELAALDVTDVCDDVLHIRASKTDQAGRGLVVPIATPARRALTQWLARCPATGAVFRQVRRGGVIGERLDAGGINRIVKQRVAAAGLDPRDYSAHGLRSGFMTECERAGLPLPAVMALTGHRSADVAVGYVHATHAHRNPVLGFLDRWGA